MYNQQWHSKYALGNSRAFEHLLIEIEVQPFHMSSLSFLSNWNCSGNCHEMEISCSCFEMEAYLWNLWNNIIECMTWSLKAFMESNKCDEQGAKKMDRKIWKMTEWNWIKWMATLNRSSVKVRIELNDIKIRTARMRLKRKHIYFLNRSPFMQNTEKVAVYFNVWINT